ncbi:hypothetical protein [Paractinoplanes rishiriensis]|uniref:hypothetical protein n=1 Tax=Paractinoplanes rishiriensis TaxID=1050105 RepID=UPI001944845C|nr:hypothetical protein [Actinoplanes rishiriensis]
MPGPLLPGQLVALVIVVATAVPAVVRLHRRRQPSKVATAASGPAGAHSRCAHQDRDVAEAVR